MHSTSREEIAADYAALRDVVARISGHSYDALTTPERFTYLEALEREARRLPVAGHELINQIDCQATPAELGGKFPHVLADRLRITRGEATRRITDARALGTRQTLTGEPLAPRYAATAGAQRAGHIGASHIAVIHRFFDELPCWVDAHTREAAEADLARWASEQRPEGLRKTADRLTCYLNPDGQFNDQDRARRRGLTLGTQDSDGMSPVRGWLTPEARATWEAVLAKLAAPGMCNPDDDTPVVDGAPPEEAVQRDTRTAPQRNHDGLNAAMRAMLASGNLGQHNGLPVAIVVTTTLDDLEAAAGKGLTGGAPSCPCPRSSASPATPIITWRSSTRAKHSRCITPNGWPHRDNELSCTPETAGARRRAATSPATAAKSTTSKTGLTPTGPTSTSSPWPADPTTDSSTKAGPPEDGPMAISNGSHHPTTTTAITWSSPLEGPVAGQTEHYGPHIGCERPFAGAET